MSGVPENHPEPLGASAPPDTQNVTARFVGEVRCWAGLLSAENRERDYVSHWYLRPEAVEIVCKRLQGASGGVFGLVGLQGVGKSNALIAIEDGLVDWRRLRVYEATGRDPVGRGVVRFKWVREQQLFASLLNGTHPLSGVFRREYGQMLISDIKSENPVFSEVHGAEIGELEMHPERLSLTFAEKMLGVKAVRDALQVTWLSLLKAQEFILIDTPDYSRSDRRAMFRDLEDIYWLWDRLSVAKGPTPTILIAIQKELCQGHFFYGRMEMVELEPLTPEQLRESYVKRFGGTQPFTGEALLNLGRLSRGVFRRFLRYVTLTLDLWERESGGKGEIGVGVVERAVPWERACEDMALELAELFPRHAALQKQAARILFRLKEVGVVKQTELAEQLHLEPYELSRILAKLEVHEQITRTREGVDKIVRLKQKTPPVSG